MQKATEEKVLKLSKNKQDIKSLSTELKAAKKEESLQTQVSDKLLEEANKRLKKALDRGIFSEAKIAQSMIEGVMISKEQGKCKRKLVDTLEKQLEQKKDSLITTFSKKPKTVQ